LNSGKLVVFGGLTPAFGHPSPLRGEGPGVRLTEALEAAISFPVIFKPKKLKIGGKVMALADGGIRENCPISVAAKIPGVKRIIACDLGYCGQLKGDFNKKSAVEVFMQCLELTTSFSQINRYINDDIFLRKNISVRIVNPGIFDVFPFDLKEIPSVMKRACRSSTYAEKRQTPGRS
jgi:predicted acylesterase/phospholipase RssA